jgi:hypothetical protein
MTFASAGVALTRSKISFGGTANRPSIDPCSIAFDDGSAREHRRFPEVDCQLSTSAPRTLAAEGRAAALAVGTDRVLIAAGTLSEETYLRALGAHLGMAFDPLDEIPCAPYPIGNDRLIKFAAGLLPMMINNVCLVVAPRASAARRIGGITKRIRSWRAAFHAEALRWSRHIVFLLINLPFNPCPLYPRERTFAVQNGTSAFGQ